jgi:hypothetical protein
MSVVYEITATVRADLAADYERFMREEHIPDLLATDLFTEAELLTDGNGSFRMVYISNNRAELDRYLTEFAPEMRRRSLDRFPEGVDISRAEWNVVQTWEC